MVQASCDTLTEIARDPSVNARSILLSTLSDLVCKERQATQDEVAALCGVAKFLLAVADESARSHFAATIAPNKHVTREIVFLLCNDKVEIAGPVLKYSPVFTEADLRQFVTTLSDEYLAFVAQREKLGSDLVEVLVSRGGEIVQLAISENSGAPLSPKSVKVLIHTAETSETLCQSLIRRPEIDKADAEHLVQLIAKLLKARMRAPNADLTGKPAGFDAPSLDDSPKKAPAKTELADILTAVKANTMTPNQAVNILADEDRTNDLAALIGYLARMDDLSVMRLLLRSDANGIGMILKALDITEATFGSVIGLRKRKLKTSDTQIRYEREDFAKLSLAEAKATLTQLAGPRK